MMFLVLACVMVGTLAEPPVDRRYLPPGQFQVEQVPQFKSPSTQYRAPAAPFESLKSSKLSHSSLSGAKQISGPVGKPVVPSSQYGPPPPQRLAAAPSNQYGPPPPQRLAVATSNQYGPPPPQRLAVAPSNQYGPPPPQRLAVAPSNQYGPPTPQRLAVTPSNQYGPPPPQRLAVAPSNQYGPPVTPQRINVAPAKKFSALTSFQNAGNIPSAEYGVPHRLSAPTNQHKSPALFQNFVNAPSNQYRAAVASQLLNTKPSTQYGPPVSSQRLVSTSSKEFSAPTTSQKLAQAPSSPSKVNDQLNGASLKSPAKLYSAPITSARSGQLKAPAVSGQYSAPKVADVKLSVTTSSVPSTHYGAPYDAAIHSAPVQHGTQSARLEILEEVSGGHEDGTSEPANYEFAYEVQAYEYGNEFGHRESRHGEDAKGEYHVELPDGRRQVVEYQADLEGYRPVIRYEESRGTVRRENLSAGGPY